MRLLIVLIIGGFLGWIAGSLYPAPQAWLTKVNLPGIQERLNTAQQTAPQPPPAATMPASTPVSLPTPSTTTAPAHSGPVDAQTLAQYRAWIHDARQLHPYADSEDRMYAVMMCESRGQATLVNRAGPYTGLFQYGTATWNGAWNSYRTQSVLDPHAQILATALAWQNHMQEQWGCYTHPQ